MTNWLAGGSCFAPNEAGLNVPLELSLAVHSDAGFQKIIHLLSDHCLYARRRPMEDYLLPACRASIQEHLLTIC